MCQVQWMNEEQKLQWPKLRPLGDVGIAVEKKSSDSIRLKAGDFASAKFAESIGETHSLFFFKWRHPAYQLIGLRFFGEETDW